MSVVAVLGATTSAQTLQQRQAPDNAALVYPSTYSEHWIEDAEFLHGAALLDFDLTKYLADVAPHLLPHAEYMSHWCGFYSISPKLLLAIIEMRSGLVLASGTPAALDDPLRGLVPGTDFQTQIQNALAALYTDFYAFREAASRPGADPTSLNAATYALLNLFRGTAEPTAFVTVAAPTQTNLIATYRKLFPGLAKPIEPSIAAVPPAGLLQLPWKVGASWYFGGVHATTGADPGVMSSLDVYRTAYQLGRRYEQRVRGRHARRHGDGLFELWSQSHVAIRVGDELLPHVQSDGEHRHAGRAQSDPWGLREHPGPGDLHGRGDRADLTSIFRC